MAPTISNYKCLFCVVLLQTAFSWDVTTTKRYTTTRRPENGTSDAVTNDPYLDSNVTLPSNATDTVNDYHVYYNSSFYSDPDVATSYWIDFKQVPKGNVNTHYMLSDSHRRAAGVTLSFDFPFYGHLLRNITIATGGFLYMGDQIHSWIAATQYIAPLMANFDPSLHGSSTIQYFDNGTAFTVQWDKVLLQNRSKEPFTFQTTLLQNGDIIFVYKEIPIPVPEISDEHHPVKVGCSDAYVMERSSLIFRKKIIYEYHRLDQKNQEISNNTAIYLTALPTCLQYKDCESCINADIGFNCTWCEGHGRCSDGLNRYRQEWLQLKCQEVNGTCPIPLTSASPPIAHNGSVVIQNTTSEIKNMSTVSPMAVIPSSSVTEKTDLETATITFSSMPFTLPSSSDDKSTSSPFSESRKANQEGYKTRQDSGIGTGGIFAIVLVITLALGIGVWTYYAYKNPQSSSGQFLIKYRPSQWHWKSEESRYSASVHM